MRPGIEIALARKILEEAITLDPQWAVPYGMLSFNYTIDYRLAQDPQESLKKIYEYIYKLTQNRANYLNINAWDKA